MKKTLLTALAVMGSTAAMAAYVDIVPTENKVYKVNEPITFNVTAWESKDKKMTAGKVTVSVHDCGAAAIGEKIIVDLAKNNPATFTTKLSRPGFILVRSVLRGADGKAIAIAKGMPSLGAAAVEPEKIKAGAPVTADFEKFWQDGIKAWEKAEVVTTPDQKVDKGNKFKKHNHFRIKVTFPDKSGAIDGFLSIPKKPGKYPLVYGVPGAGPGQIVPGAPYCPPQDVIMLWMNVHQYPTADNAAEQKKRYEAYNKKSDNGRYCFDKANDREKFTYRKVWLSVNRAANYVMTLPEFDGKNVAAVGSSQGGGSALALTYLNPKVTCTVANVPALCDHNGWKANRAPGWPGLHKVWKGAADETAQYFDGANFAAFIKNPAIISVGYIDTTCSPSSVYAAFNNLKGKKTMFPMPRLGHTSSPEFAKAASKYVQNIFISK